jgi:Xaa-Pro aminopeptidase
VLYTKEDMITSSEYQTRRATLRQAYPGQLIVLTAHDAVQKDRDSSFFYQEANFRYLTGVNEPGWMLLLNGDEELLYAPKISDAHELFDGSLSWDSVVETSGIAQIKPCEELTERLKELVLKDASAVTLLEDPQQEYYDFETNPALVRLREETLKDFSLVDCRRQLARQRAIKSDAEVALIEAAIQASSVGFEKVAASLDSLSHEYQIEAELSHAFRNSGTTGHAYDPIVAAAGNACTLHYCTNNDAVNEGDLILIDAGALVDGYAADITRTYIKGDALERQKALYAAVKTAHEAIVQLLRPGLLIAEYQKSVDRIMKEALTSVGLLNSKSDYRKYFPHAISHGLGLNVHDSLGGYESFQPGMVLTVEPGIYVPEEAIGIRIEDDILITEHGHRNLSAHLSIEM